MTLPRGAPAHTIGWDVIRWAEQMMLSPMGDGAPLALTGEQLRFLAWWYAVDGDGRWLFRRGVLRRAKGWGKDPLAAVVAFVEMLGPCRFAGWAADGSAAGCPVAQPPLVAAAAVSKEQTLNTTTVLPTIAGPDMVARHRLRIGVSGLTRGRTAAGGAAKLMPVTTSWRASEGGRLTAVVASETHHMVAANGGLRMVAVLGRNLAKAPDGAARLLSVTNAHEPGEDSVAENDHEAWLAQQRDGGGDILLDDRHAVVGEDFDVTDRAAMVAAMRAAYGDSAWVDLARLAAEADDPEMTSAAAKRFFLNRVTAGSRAWMDPAALDAAWREGPIPDAGSAVAAGFDGSRTRDATALVAVEMSSGFVWPVAVWERDWSDDLWEVPADEVQEAVERLFGTFRVARMYADPAFWEGEVSRWVGRWGPVAEWEMRGQHAVRAARAFAAFRGALHSGAATWGGQLGDVFRRHCLNAVERPLADTRSDGGRLHVIGKSSRASTRCIDVAVAAVLASQARLDAISAGWSPPPRFRAWSVTEARRLRDEQQAEAAVESAR